MHPAIGVLRQLAVELRALLTRLDSESAGSWQASWTRCQELFGAYRADEPDIDGLPADEREELAGALDEVVRLNAVAAGLVTRETEKITEDLRRVAASKKRLSEQSDVADTAPMGGHCDVQG